MHELHETVCQLASLLDLTVETTSTRVIALRRSDGADILPASERWYPKALAFLATRVAQRNDRLRLERDMETARAEHNARRAEAFKDELGRMIDGEQAAKATIAALRQADVETRAALRVTEGELAAARRKLVEETNRADDEWHRGERARESLAKERRASDKLLKHAAELREVANAETARAESLLAKLQNGGAL